MGRRMGVLFRDEVTDYRRTRLEGEVVLTQPLSTRIIVTVLAAAIAAAGIWLVFGNYARIEAAPGILVTDEPAAKIIAPIGGVVAELLVKEGSNVAKGDRIAVIQLDRSSASGLGVAGEGLAALKARRTLGEAQIVLSGRKQTAEQARLSMMAAAAGQQLTELRSQIALQKQIVVSHQSMFERIARVVDEGFVSKVEFERRRQSMLASQQVLGQLEQQLVAKRAEWMQVDAQLASLSADGARDVSDIRSSLEAIAQQRAQLEGERSYVITAPIAGRVTALQSGVGRTATPNLPMMIIMPPDSALHAEVYAPSRAIGFVREGQEARLLYDAFPYQRFGSFSGKIRSVSQIVIDPRESDVPIKLEGPVYRVIIVLDRQVLGAFGHKVPLQPGMTLTANIVLERQSFLAWILTPLNAVMKRTT